MAAPASSPRRYRSSRREAQAAQTRTDILTAARELFESAGFAATTISAVAARAGVSTQTVYAVFGSKAKLAAGMVELMEESADAAQWRARLDVERDPRRILRAFAEWTRAFFVASKAQLMAARDVTAEMEDMAREGNSRRREALTELIGRIGATGALKRDLTEADAVDRAWMLTGLDTYLNATAGCGWSPERFASWLAETLEQQLLEPAAPTR